MASSWCAINHKSRLTHPLIRKSGKLERATWDEAMALIVQKAQETRERLTAHGIAFYTSGQLFLEEYYALAMVGKAGLNTLHMSAAPKVCKCVGLLMLRRDGNTRLCTATAAASMRESFGSDGQPGSYTDIDFTDCIFLVGHNMAATQTVLWSRVLDRLEGPNPPSLLVVDPRLSATAKKATIHLAPRIGTNMALLNGIQHCLFARGWINEEYVSQHCVGRVELEKIVSEYTPERVEEITNVPTSLLRKAAEIIGTSSSLLSTCLQGVYQSGEQHQSLARLHRKAWVWHLSNEWAADCAEQS
jgi:anaerobic selenocysteine-containing dehydrogenase